MTKVKIYGAGSIGNHLAHACRCKNWDVTLCDIDMDSLERTKNDIYPSRYGSWDENIRLAKVDALKNEKFDLVIIGTPPDTHMKLAFDVLKSAPPRALLIEKPLCLPSLEGCNELLSLAKSTGTFVAVGYNHTLTKNSQLAEEILGSGILGSALTITAMFREHWKGIFSAHPWLDGPHDSYLGFSERGGGASGEHSHAVNIWQHFSHVLNMGKIVEVSAMLDIVKNTKVNYDQLCFLNVKTSEGLMGNVIQDVITEPAKKNLRIQGTSGFLEWYVNWDKHNDMLRYGGNKGEIKDELIKKTRPDDFIGEINHIEDILEGNNEASPISLERGLDTMLVVAAAHISHHSRKAVSINYKKGYSLDAIEKH